MIRRVKTENGWVRGLPAADPRITAYKGIPFADKPVGPNRWRAPQPAKDWEGELFAADFAPIPMQANCCGDPQKEIPWTAGAGGNHPHIPRLRHHRDGSSA